MTWKPPASDGGAEIFNYVIEYRIEGGFKWVKANEDHIPVTEYTVKGLKKDSNYEFRISAENRAGVGPASEPTLPTKAKEKLGKKASEVIPYVIYCEHTISLKWQNM